MRLSKGDEALCKNLGALLGRVAEGQSVELVKKVLRLNGLQACIQRGAEADPDLVDKIVTKLKDPLSRGRKAKKEQLELKRDRDQRRKEENNERAKRLCARNARADEVPVSASAVDQESRQTREDSAATHLVDRPNPIRSSPESQTNHSAAMSDGAHRTLAGNDAVEDSTHRGRRSTTRHMSEAPRQSRDMDVRATATTRPRSINRPPWSRLNSYHENEIDTTNTDTTVPTSQAVPIAAIPDCRATRPEHGTATTSLGGLPNEQTDRAATAFAAPSVVAQVGTSEMVDQREVALISGDEAQKEIFESHLIEYVWPQFEHRIKLGKRAQHIEEIVAMTDQLNFWTIQHDLLGFAERRQKAPGVIARVSDLAKNSDPVAIFHAIEASQTNEIDAKLHRVYGQVRLVRSIEETIANGYEPSEATLSLRHKRKEYWGYFLSDMADSMCEGESEETRDKTWGKLCREYDAGKRWLDTIQSFGGEGIVFIFIFASTSDPLKKPRDRMSLTDELTGELPGIQCYAVSHTYTAFQRACIELLFTWIPSMSRLVECFGADALDRFCRLGRLEEGTMSRIRGCEGPKIAPTESFDEMEMDEDEDSE